MGLNRFALIIINIILRGQISNKIHISISYLCISFRELLSDDFGHKRKIK